MLVSKRSLTSHVAARADGELQAVETDAVQIRHAAECGEDDVGLQDSAVLERHFDLREAVEARARDLGAAAILPPIDRKAARNPLRSAASRNPSGSAALSSSVTAQPSAAKIEAYSQAITPLPSTIKVRGMYGRLKIESLSSTCS